MKEKEPKRSLLTWERAVMVFASAGAGYILGSGETREKISFCCRAAWNVIKRRNRVRTIHRKANEILRQVYPHGM